MPTSLLAAIQARYAAAGLEATIGPLTPVRAGPGAAYPRVAVEAIQERLPGPTAEDRDVEVTFAVLALSVEDAQAGARLLYAGLDPGPGRAPLAWDTGSEVTCVRDTTKVGLLPGQGSAGVYIYRAAVPYCFRITGDP